MNVQIMGKPIIIIANSVSRILMWSCFVGAIALLFGIPGLYAFGIMETAEIPDWVLFVLGGVGAVSTISCLLTVPYAIEHKLKIKKPS